MSDTMNTGDVGRRLGLVITVELLAKLGFKAVDKNKRASIWKQSDYPAMCVSIADYIRNRQDVPMQPTPPRKDTTAPVSNLATSGSDSDLDDDDEL